MSGRVRVLFRMHNKSCTNWIHSNIFAMLRIVPLVPNAMICEAPFPYFHSGARLFHEAMGESALDELHGFLQRHKWSGSQEQMEMIRHEDEFIESECSALAISIERFNKQFRG